MPLFGESRGLYSLISEEKKGAEMLLLIFPPRPLGTSVPSQAAVSSLSRQQTQDRGCLSPFSSMPNETNWKRG